VSQTVVMNGDSNTRVSYDSVLVGTGKQKGLESLSENRERRRRCDVERQVVPDGGTRNRKRPLEEKRTDGTSRRCEVEDHSRSVDVMSATRVKQDSR